MCVIASNRWNTSERVCSPEAGPIPYRSRSAARCSSADLSRNASPSTGGSTKASVTRTMDFARYPSFRARSSSSATAAIASGPQKQRRVLRSYESGVPYASRRACVIWMERRTTAFCRTIAMIRYSYRELHEAVRIPRHRARIGRSCGGPPEPRRELAEVEAQVAPVRDLVDEPVEEPRREGLAGPDGEADLRCASRAPLSEPQAEGPPPPPHPLASPPPLP